jgi:hypothetical protein
MIKVLASTLIVCAIALSAAAQQTFTGRLSDSTCGVSHQPKRSSDTDRECLFACINRLAKYVLVDENGHVTPIANQDAAGLPLYAGRPVKLTGERNGDAIVIAKVEAIPAHLHLGHVMTNWRDTPGTRGFLPVAIDEARVAAVHAGLAVKSAGLQSMEDVKLHAAHVLNALDPTVEPRGPAAGYGVRKAVSDALQHLELAARAEGATPVIVTHAAIASGSLSNVLQLVDQAIAVAQRVRAFTDAADVAAAAADLAALTRRISEDGLREAQTELQVILKAEGILGAPKD